MGNFACNSLEDLVFNRSFKDWVLSNGVTDAAFWENWVEQNHHKAALVNQAKATIHALQIDGRLLSAVEIEGEIKKIIHRLQQKDSPAEEPASFTQSTHTSHKKIRLNFLRAACIIAVLLAGYRLWLFTHKTPRNDVYASFVESKKDGLLEHINVADSIQAVYLPDGSKVWLRKDSKLTYLKKFSDNKRIVYLTGEAFFEITKNPDRPFWVHTNSIVTKVLGTSFIVRAYPNDKEAVIEVKTGKVSVFKTNGFEEAATPGGLVLTPNQKCIYDKEKDAFDKALARHPFIQAHIPDTAFVFDATPVNKVFEVMHNAYGIPIVYDEDAMGGCSLSAALGNESFYEKMDLICRAVNASYEVIDGTIVITCKKCKP